MITIEQAHAKLKAHLGDSPKATHCRVVAHLMRQLAEKSQENADLWEVVGLCHDLDETETKGNRQLHGILTAQWLADDLPSDALEAIRAHDHRTGVKAETELADALKLADALAIADEDAGREAIGRIGTEGGWHELSERLVRRPYLLPIISDLCNRMDESLADLAGLFDRAPRQDAHP
ncbi:HD domain-containing protein [Methyloligella sp. 2.7D]|uniref:HD domain-containing protein n=1 Tax=unclassified Methyloligella TaxID=2625955 RepID=UPI00157C44D4|nr:HD domain-containing protein [Methyloligella sp. GL2]QKP76808.1 HD domain-containing protein [Methyloligella sp. GL2]